MGYSPWKVISLLFGIGCLLAGGFFIMMIFAFAAMIDPELEGTQWWDVYVSKIGSASGFSGISQGLILIIGGMYLVWLSVPSKDKNSKIPEV